MATLLIAWASKHGKMPDEAYELYLKKPDQFRLIWGYESWEKEEEKREYDKENAKIKS